MASSTPPAQLTVADVNAWRAWLDTNEHTSNGVWLTLAKKGTTVPTSLTYAEALTEALCSGWIDGRKNAVDGATYRQHFTPRRARSMWSKRNVDLVGGLIATGRMRERGLAEIALAKANGRWDRAYAGAATIDIPAELQAALDTSPAAASAFGALTSGSRYPILLQLVTAPNDTVRAARISRHVDRLAASATPEQAH
jgi:uncharacterized protein YdeI (YjbR/CyaY-like superfamily)